MKEDSKLSKRARIALIAGFSPFILMFVIAISISFVNRNFGNIECKIKNEYSKLNFNGKVTNKNYDKENHNFRFIEVLDSTKTLQKFFLIFNETVLWDKISIGDEIIKKGGSLKFVLIRKGETIIIEPEFDCGENDFWIESEKYKF